MDFTRHYALKVLGGVGGRGEVKIGMAPTYGFEKKSGPVHFAPHYTTLSWIFDGVAAPATPRP